MSDRNCAARDWFDAFTWTLRWLTDGIAIALRPV